VRQLGKNALRASMNSFRYARLPWPAVQSRALVRHLQQSDALELFRSSSPPLVSQPGEIAGEFRARAATQMREQRDAAKEALRAKYNAKIAPHVTHTVTIHGEVSEKDEPSTMGGASATCGCGSST